MNDPGRHILINVPVHNDGWDRHYLEVLEDLDRQFANPQADKVIFQVAEGVGLAETGVLAMIEQWHQRTGHPRHRIEITCHNTVESIPYHNGGFGACILNEGSTYSRYLPVKANAKRFGIFIGRLTLPRVCMSWHMAHYHGRNTLMSWMPKERNPQCYLRNLQKINWMHDLVPLTRDITNWWREYDPNAVQAWYQNDRPSSIDGHVWEDQYRLGQRLTNQSLVDHYDKFCIEIIAETANYGNSFWVTEKTARPLVTGKPFLLFGTKNFLRRLKDLGFRTFHSLWDENYDQLEGFDRWMAMRDVIAELCRLDRVSWRDLMLSAHAIALENYKHYHSTAPWSIDDPWPRDDPQQVK